MNIDDKLKGLKRRNIPSDLDRVLGMSRFSLEDMDHAAHWTAKLGTGGAKLRKIQGEFLTMVCLFGGVFGAVGVGHGKTLMSLLAAMACGAERPLIMVPPALVEQMKGEVEYWSLYFKFKKPEVLSYGILSTRSDILKQLNPDLIVADEAHYLRHKTSARTRRFLRYFHNNPRCNFVALSGTITQKSLLDYAHLLELALRERAPIPLNRFELERWAACIDPDGEPTRSDLNRLGYLVRWSSQSDFTPIDKKSIRLAFQERLKTTPGVITTGECSCGSSLYLVKKAPRHRRQIADALKRLTNEWCTPDGEPIADASTKSRTYKNLSMGFYYKWDWGASGPDFEWLEAKRNLNRLIGKVLRYSPREGRDSPALVVDWSRNGGGSKELRDAVHLWDRIRDRADPTPKAVWLDKSKIKFVGDFLYDLGEPCVVWYASKAVGESLRSALGLTLHGAGSPPPTGDTCAASINVHGKGRNLQMYKHCFIVEPPSNGATFEQLLGRTHRAGQEADAVWWYYFDFGGAVAKAKAHAEYIEETQGTKQKLNLATYINPKKRKQ